MFAILVLMALFTTFITTPTVMAIYKPSRGISFRTRRKLSDDLRVLACVHGPGNVPSIISLIECTRSPNKSSLKLFIMHLVELTERSSSIILARRARKNGFPFFNRYRGTHWHDPLAGAFQAYSQLGRVSVRPTTAISSLTTMHEDICHVAEEKRVTMIILPFHKQWRRMEREDEEKGGDDEIVENVGHAWSVVNQKVLRNAPCSVAVLVDRGFGDGNKTPGPNVSMAQNICIAFFGGPDDREALALCSRMAQHPVVKLSVVRFIDTKMDATSRCNENSSDNSYNGFSTVKMNREREEEMDEAAVVEFRSKWEGVAVYMEKVGNSTVEEVMAIGRGGEYDLIVVGRGRLRSRLAEHAELGPIGDILASSGNEVKASVLVVQQHDTAPAEEEAASSSGV